MPAARGPSPSTIELVATCAFGLESVVARELRDLGFDAVPLAEATGRVAWRVPLAEAHSAIAAANLWLRAADRVLVRVAEFAVGGGDDGFEALFQGARAVAWEQWIHADAMAHVSGRCVRSLLTSEPAVQRATKRAIVERLRFAHGLSSSARLAETGPRVGVEVSILRDRASLTIDTSGIGLHKRGYRRGGRSDPAEGRASATGAGEAALRETMAAGLVLLSTWRPGRALVDPFCGSGTIAIEAAMLARAIAPGLGRRFEAEAWWAPDGPGEGKGRTLIDPAVWAEARDEAKAAIVPDRLNPVIHASDNDERVLSLARANAKAAGVAADIQFLKRDVADFASTLEQGCVITNPPYGERLGDPREIERLYRAMPVVFRRLPTWSFHILTGRLDLEELFGQPAARRRKLYNSTIECGYFTFVPGGGMQRRHAAELTAEPAPSEVLVAGSEPPETMADSIPDALVVAPVAPMDADPETSADGAVVLAPDAAPAREVPAFHPRIKAAFSSSPDTPAPTFGGLGEREARDAADFERRLVKNLRHLRRYPARGITCYRVYERDVPDVPVIVDRYEDWYHVAEYERPHDRTPAQQADWFDLLQAAISRAAGVPIDQVVMKAKHRQRGLTQHEKQGESGSALVVNEGGLRFEVNLRDYIDTGLFLDHRLTRAMVREQCAQLTATGNGPRVLNLFCYTGSFSVYAAAGGAKSITSVDLSNTYLAWAQRNLALNGFTGSAHTPHALVRSDVVEFLRTQRAPAGGRGLYDVAIIDPPTFSNSTSTEEDWEVATGHVAVLEALGPLMSRGGVAYFSNNFRRFHLDEAAIDAAGWRAREISNQTVPTEYRNRRIHRCWRLERG